MTTRFGLTFDYRCPFARNGHEAAVAALRGGEPPVWERDPGSWGTGVLALLYGIAVRDRYPDRFLDAHLALFAQRHDHGKKLGHEEVLQEAVESVGLDAAAVKDEAWSGRPLATLAAEHTRLAADLAVFGVPTIVTEDDAVFVRFMERGRTDDLLRALDLVGWDRLNEFKRTRIPR
jgi:hypothetical protein